MNDKNLLDRYTSRVSDTAPTNVEEPDEADDLGAFGWLRGSRERAVCLQLRKKTGNIVAIPYALLEVYAFNPSEGITLKTVSQTIRIIGRNLNVECRPNLRLFDGITRNRVPWIQETQQLMSSGGADGVVVVEHIELGADRD